MTNLPMTYDAQVFISGEFTGAASGMIFEIINPTAGSVIGAFVLTYVINCF